MSYVSYSENSWTSPCLVMHISGRYLVYVGHLTSPFLETDTLR